MFMSRIPPLWIAVALATVRGTAGEPPSEGYVGEWTAEKGAVVMLRGAGGASPVEGFPGAVEWKPWPLRTGSAEDPASMGGVRAAGGSLARLQIRSDFQLIAFEGIGTDATGIAAVTPAGLSVLVQSSGHRYRLEDDGVYLSPGGSKLAVLVRGDEREELLVLDVRGSGPVFWPVDLDSEVERVERGSLAATGTSAFFTARTAQGLAVYRVTLDPPEAGGSSHAERITEHYGTIEPYGAASESTFAFLAGESEDALDVLVATGAGIAINVTSSPGAILASRPGETRLAVSRDGKYVAFNRGSSTDTETFLQTIAAPGPAGSFQITTDDHFNPYIDQEILIFFGPTGSLVFAAGHDAVTTDVFRVDPSAVTQPINLTRTGSTLDPPFLRKGTLGNVSVTVSPEGIALISALGFPGDGSAVPLVVGASVANGDLLAAASLHSATGYITIGSELYFFATETTGLRGVYRLSGTELTELALSAAGTEPRLLFQSVDHALVVVPGKGVLSIYPSGVTWLSTLGPDGASGAEDLARGFVAFGPLTLDGQTGFRLVDLATGSESWLAEAQAGSEILALARPAPLFVRGDVNADGSVDIADPIGTLLYLYAGAHGVTCLDAADADDDGTISITDPIHTLQYLFLTGASLPPPAGAPGPDPTPDALSCDR